MTMFNCLIELLPSGGSYTLLRRLWGSFLATLRRDNPLYSLNWSRAESLVSFFLMGDCLLCVLGCIMFIAVGVSQEESWFVL